MIDAPRTDTIRDRAVEVDREKFVVPDVAAERQRPEVSDRTFSDRYYDSGFDGAGSGRAERRAGSALAAEFEPDSEIAEIAATLFGDTPPSEAEMALLGEEVRAYQEANPEASAEEALNALAGAGKGTAAVLAAHVLQNGGSFTYNDDVDGDRRADAVKVTFTPGSAANGNTSTTEKEVNLDGDDDIEIAKTVERTKLDNGDVLEEVSTTASELDLDEDGEFDDSMQQHSLRLLSEDGEELVRAEGTALDLDSDDVVDSMRAKVKSGDYESTETFDRMNIDEDEELEVIETVSDRDARGAREGSAVWDSADDFDAGLGPNRVTTAEYDEEGERVGGSLTIDDDGDGTPEFESGDLGEQEGLERRASEQERKPYHEYE